ncbi:MAG: hypothetical protein HY234_02235 [Acidobacteria bacterium]|nr:hypothetical protein [Acidobacteriota bacterium]MBI3661859.1 hypothetical protein [Acidobacteriota bacterium]
MGTLRFEKAIRILFVLALLVRGVGTQGQTKETAEERPSGALASALVAACRQNEAQFARYQTAENAAAFAELTPSQKSDLMKRIVQAGDAGRPLLSSAAEGRTVLRCETTRGTTELRFGTERIRENLAFVPVEATGGRRAEFGMVREGGGWRMLSVGLVLMNIPELAKQWATPKAAAGAAENSEAAAIVTLRRLAEAVVTYKKGFGKLPTQLAQLGPARRGEISPEKANLIEQELAEGTKGGYVFAYRVVAPPKTKDAKEAAGESTEPAYALTATPAEYGRTGKRSFFLDASGELRGGDKQGAEATAEDPQVEP